MYTKKYDLIFGIGGACSCSTLLRNRQLQNFSYPFDWVSHQYFKGSIDILGNKFKNFIEYEDLEYICSPLEHDIYRNKSNNMLFNHDFPKNYDKNRKESFLLVKEKYDRRINRLLTKISESKRVLMVYLEIVRLQEEEKEREINSDEFIVNSYQKIISAYNFKNSPLCRLFGRTMDLLYIGYDPYIPPKKIIKKQLCDGLTRMTINYKLDDLHHNSVDFSMLHKVLRNFSIG
jgi:hypothetical protein